MNFHGLVALFLFFSFSFLSCWAKWLYFSILALFTSFICEQPIQLKSRQFSLFFITVITLLQPIHNLVSTLLANPTQWSLPSCVNCIRGCVGHGDNMWCTHYSPRNGQSHSFSYVCLAVCFQPVTLTSTLKTCSELLLPHTILFKVNSTEI